MLPAATPTTISISATEMPTRMEIRLATNASPIQIAAMNQMLSSAAVPKRKVPPQCRAKKAEAPHRVKAPNPPPRKIQLQLIKCPPRRRCSTGVISPEALRRFSRHAAGWQTPLPQPLSHKGADMGSPLFDGGQPVSFLVLRRFLWVCQHWRFGSAGDPNHRRWFIVPWNTPIP